MEPSRTLADAAMPFLDHLQELRGCLARTCIAIIVGSIVCFMWSGELFSFLTLPLHLAFDKVSLIGTGPAEAFIVKLKVSIVAGILVTSPYSFFELWRFIAPGLHSNEKGAALPFVFFSTLFFLTGVGFCYYIIFPFTFSFFMEEFASIGIEPTIKIGEYLSFVVKLLSIFGLVFELPVLTFLLSRLGLVSHLWLIDKFRYAVVGIFVIAAILTPPDVITQLLLAGPLIFLYGVCIAIARFVTPKKKSS